MRLFQGSAVVLLALTLTGGTLAAQGRPATAATPATPAPSPANEVVVVATDFRFEAPASVDAGLVNFRLFNRGRELHHLLVIRIDRMAKTSEIAELLKANDWNVPWMHALGGPESVAPGGVSSASMVLEPGRYVLACVVSSPSTHRQHFMDGMIRELLVVKAPGPTRRAMLPNAAAKVTLFEWNFTFEGTLAAGRRDIRVENIGRFEHQMWIVRMSPGRTLDEAVKWAENPQGVAPFESVGGTTGLGPGRSINITVDLLPGDYALLCTLYNPLSRKTHSAHGMIKPFRVVN